jgi:hypothetical protein
VKRGHELVATEDVLENHQQQKVHTDPDFQHNIPPIAFLVPPVVCTVKELRDWCMQAWYRQGLHVTKKGVTLRPCMRQSQSPQFTKPWAC